MRMSSWIKRGGRALGAAGVLTAATALTALVSFETASLRAAAKGQPSPPATVFAQWAGSSGHNPVLPGSDPATFTVHLESQAIIGGIAVVGPTAYVGSNSGQVFAVDRTSGRILWHAALPNEVMSTPLVVGNLVVVGVGNSLFAANERSGLARIRGTGPSGVYALNRTTGKPVWHVVTRGECMPTAAYYHGNVYQMTGSGDLLEIQAATGTVLRRHMLGEFDSMASPSLQGGILIVDTAPQQVMAVALPTLAVLWHTSIPAVSGVTDVSPARSGPYVALDAVTSLKHLGGSLAYGTETLFVLDASNGRILWSQVLGSGHLRTDVMQTAVPTIVGGTVYVGSPIAKRVSAFDLASGRLLWSVATHGEVKDDPAATAGHVYFADSAGYVYDVNAATGKLVADRQLAPGSRVYGSGAAAFGIGTGGLLLVGAAAYCATSQGLLIAFPLSDFVTGRWAGA